MGWLSLSVDWMILGSCCNFCSKCFFLVVLMLWNLLIVNVIKYNFINCVVNVFVDVMSILGFVLVKNDIVDLCINELFEIL